jgi:FKBP-type peptidyl-prolyl cis-trans isomerase
MTARVLRITVGLLLICIAGSIGCAPEAHEPRGTLPPADVAAPPPDAQMTASGLAYRVLARGGPGRRPTANSRVLVNYTGWTTDGTIVDGAPIGGPPVTITLDETMPGWQEGVRLMSRGDKFRFWIPAALAYAGAPGKPSGMLVYDIYLVDFND